MEEKKTISSEWEFEHLEVTKDPKNYITTVIMNHPPLAVGDSRVNTIGPKLLDNLDKVVDLLYDDTNTRVIILRGSKNCFSGGADFGANEASSPWLLKKRTIKGSRIFKRFRDIPTPVIAAIEGYAFGGGLELAMNCDFRFAVENAFLGLPEVTVGMHPGWGGNQLMVRHIGVGRAMELILTGKVISAQEAYRIGLITQFFDSNRFDRGVYRFAKNMTKNCNPIGVGIAKQMINFGAAAPLDVGLEMEAYGIGMVSTTNDFMEGITALLEKRKPKYKNQ